VCFCTAFSIKTSKTFPLAAWVILLMALFGKFGDSFVKGIQKATTGFVSAADANADEILQERDYEKEFGILWEQSENCITCRGCDVQFTVVERKHHCRTCAGVFCNSCCPFDLSNRRVCLGCTRGEITGETLRSLIRSKIEAEEARTKTSKKPVKKALSARKQDLCDEEDDQTLKEITQGLEKVFIRGGDFLGVGMVTGFLRSKNLRLVRGSAYNEDGSRVSGSRGSKSIPLAGYFEFRNKSNECVCIKVVEREEEANDIKYEAVRPVFICVPPSDSIHAFFDQEKYMMEMVILFNNPNEIPSGASLVFDTQARGVTPDVITPCAKVNLFKVLPLSSTHPLSLLSHTHMTLMHSNMFSVSLYVFNSKQIKERASQI